MFEAKHGAKAALEFRLKHNIPCIALFPPDHEFTDAERAAMAKYKPGHGPTVISNDNNSVIPDPVTPGAPGSTIP